MKANELTNHSQSVLEEFDSAALSWGRARSHINGALLTRTETQYNQAKASLIARMKYLEKENRRLRGIK